MVRRRTYKSKSKSMKNQRNSFSLPQRSFYGDSIFSRAIPPSEWPASYPPTRTNENQMSFFISPHLRQIPSDTPGAFIETQSTDLYWPLGALHFTPVFPGIALLGGERYTKMHRRDCSRTIMLDTPSSTVPYPINIFLLSCSLIVGFLPCSF